jgi:hypothetical protein
VTTTNRLPIAQAPGAISWKQRLLRQVAGLFAFEVISGFAVWLLPFSVSAQFLVLFHTGIGLAFVIPFVIAQIQHIPSGWKNGARFYKWLGVTGCSVVVLAVASGIVVTLQASLGTRVSFVWHYIHLVSSIAAVPVVLVHVTPLARRLAQSWQKTAVAGAPRPWARELFAVPTVLLGVTFAAIVFYSPVNHLDYSLSADYVFAYGPNPFAPSLSTTSNGRPVAPQVLASSEACGSSGFHSTIYREWQASAHRWAAEDKFFQAVQAVMIKEEGAPAARYCGGCHDPVSLLSGYKDASTGISAPGFKQGDSCVVCHAMRRVDVQGNGNYVFEAPKPYLYEYFGDGVALGLARFLIRAYPGQHDRDYDLTLAQRPESCGGCHKQFIDKAINHFGWVQLQNQYDDWKQGKWNADADPARRLRCQQCHMYFEDSASDPEADPYDLKAGLGRKHRNHYFAAGNQFMPGVISSPDAAGQIRRVEQWLYGERIVPEIAAVWPAGPLLPIKIVGPGTADPGELISLRAVVSNNKVGHSFPTGPLDLIRAWVELIVRDQAGREIFHSGKLDGQNHIEPGSFVLKAVGVNPDGHEIVRHDLWHLVGAKFKRAIFPGYSDMYPYEFRVPKNAKGPLEVTARLRYRKANQYFMDLVFPGEHRTADVTDISADRVEIALRSGKGKARARAASTGALVSARQNRSSP